jgi:hypothetical protein
VKSIRVTCAVLLMLASTVPARADFKYVETSQITGGALVGMMKFASVFARGDAKRQEKQALQPTTTTRYVKGGRLRTDNPDGTAQIIDLEHRRIIMIDLNKKTYAVATFDQIKAAFDQAQQQMQQQIQQDPKLTDQQKQQLENTQLQITPTVRVTPGASNRVILDQPTNETKVQMDLAMQATSTGPDAPPPGQPNSVVATYSMNMDTFVARSVSGYQEFAQFYRRMATEVNWMKLPANVKIDPRVSQGMSELQQNSDALKGFPLLSYVSMTLAATSNGQPVGDQTSAQNQSSNPPPSNPPPASSTNSSDNSIPTSPSAAMMKGLGGLFGRKKQDNSSASSNQSSPDSTQSGANSNSGSLIEITTQVTSFSDSSLDAGLFDIPSGYTQLQEDPWQVYGGGGSQQQQMQRPAK